MKKILTEKYESFTAKDLKNYSKIVNAYFRRKKFLLLISFTTNGSDALFFHMKPFHNPLDLIDFNMSFTII